MYTVCSWPDVTRAFFNLYAQSVAVIRIHLSKKNNPLLYCYQILCFYYQSSCYEIYTIPDTFPSSISWLNSILRTSEISLDVMLSVTLVRWCTPDVPPLQHDSIWNLPYIVNFTLDNITWLKKNCLILKNSKKCFTHLFRLYKNKQTRTKIKGLKGHNGIKRRKNRCTAWKQSSVANPVRVGGDIRYGHTLQIY